MTIITPALPIYAREFNANASMIGLLITGFALGRLVSALPAGTYSLRRSKLLTHSGLGMIVVSSVAAAYAPNYPFLLAMRVIEGIGAGIFMTVVSTVAAALAPIGSRGRTMSIITASLLSGSAVGPLIGGPITAVWGASSTFLAYGLVVLVAMLLMALTVRYDTNTSSSEVDVKEHSHLPVTIRSLILVNFAVITSSTVWAGVGLTAIPLFSYDNLKLDSTQLGLALAASSVANLGSAFAAGWITDKIGRKLPIMTSLFSTALIISLVPLAQDYLALVVMMAVWGVSDGFWGQLTAWIADLSPRKHFGMLMGLGRVANEVGFVIGPVTMGFVIEFTSTGIVGSAPFILGSAFMVLTGILIITASDPSSGRRKI